MTTTEARPPAQPEATEKKNPFVEWLKGQYALYILLGLLIIASVSTPAFLTATNLTNLPSIPNNWLTAAGIAASALNGKGDWLVSSSYPSNSGSLAITAGGAVTVGTNSDKTGYSLIQRFPANFSSLGISAAGNVNADIKKVNAVTVNGDGAGTPWGP